MSITFHYQIDNFRIRNAGKVKRWLLSIAELHQREVQSLTYVFVTDEALLEMNRQHLQHDYYTDIITFDLSEDSALEGELYISVDRVRDNATMHGVAYLQELRRVMAHGLLHLCGYGDKSDKEIAAMRTEEDKALELYT